MNENNRWLITGGCGFIGSNFINYLKNKNPEFFIVSLDKIDYCSDKNGIQYDKLIIGSINDFDLITTILNDYQIDIIVNFAAQTHIDNSFVKPLEFTEDNIYGTHILIEAVRLYGKIKKFIHISTDEVYGDVDIEHLGCCENDILNPTNPYSATKAAAEHIVRSYYYSFKLPVIIIRCNNVYGNRQYKEKIIPKFINLLLENKKCTIHGKGITRRNFIHINDVCNAIITVLNKGELNNIYNIGSKNEYSVLDIANLLINYLKPNDDNNKWIEYIPDRNYNDFRYSINTNKLNNLGWKEEIDFNEGLIETIEYYKSK
jgi:dTDP-glucose 4,6-dehydratase